VTRAALAFNAAHNVCNARCCAVIAPRNANSQTIKERSAMNDTVNRQILLVEKPTGKLGPEHFKLSKGAIPEPKDARCWCARATSPGRRQPGLDARRDLSRAVEATP